VSTKIFPHRAFNPVKNVLPASVTQEPIQPVVDIIAHQAELEAARRERMAQRAQERAAQRKQSETEGSGLPHIASAYHAIVDAPEGCHRFFNVDIVMLGTLINQWKDKHISQATLMRTIKPVDIWDIDLHMCAACGYRLGTRRYPALLFIARPKPPSKKRPLEPVCICETCFLEDKIGVAEGAMYAYAKLAGALAIELPQKDIDFWTAQFDRHAIRYKRRPTEYEDEPHYARFNEIFTPR
jgi:hypothetical protein